jgi:hypothetical protein
MSGPPSIRCKPANPGIELRAWDSFLESPSTGGLDLCVRRRFAKAADPDLKRATDSKKWRELGGVDDRAGLDTHRLNVELPRSHK